MLCPSPEGTPPRPLPLASKGPLWQRCWQQCCPQRTQQQFCRSPPASSSKGQQNRERQDPPLASACGCRCTRGGPGLQKQKESCASSCTASASFRSRRRPRRNQVECPPHQECQRSSPRRLWGHTPRQATIHKRASRWTSPVGARWSSPRSQPARHTPPWTWRDEGGGCPQHSGDQRSACPSCQRQGTKRCKPSQGHLRP
mmetsp:Transcript_10176/g.31049  ORF Transcript_10176/g.31049 Transcript_10176/m.31049 type:complete len:200 (+) Transcript_10176:575-1174(+)